MIYGLFTATRFQVKGFTPTTLEVVPLTNDMFVLHVYNIWKQQDSSNTTLTDECDQDKAWAGFD